MNQKELDQLAYYAGEGCTCAAFSSSECACDVDWTDPEVYELRDKLKATTKRLRAYQRAMKSIDDYFEYACHSKQDAEVVHEILDKLAKSLEEDKNV